VSNLVVARYADGRVVKGTSLDVNPGRPTFHVRTADGSMTQVALTDLKALFFVRSLDGNPAHGDARDIADDDARRRGTRLVEAVFRDDERIVGLAVQFPPRTPFFFLVPVDREGNNLRILINKAQLASIAPVDAGAGSG
jgi:hypothetical protein